MDRVSADRQEYQLQTVAAEAVSKENGQQRTPTGTSSVVVMPTTGQRVTHASPAARALPKLHTLLGRLLYSTSPRQVSFPKFILRRKKADVALCESQRLTTFAPIKSRRSTRRVPGWPPISTVAEAPNGVDGLLKLYQFSSCKLTSLSSSHHDSSGLVSPFHM